MNRRDLRIIEININIDPAIFVAFNTGELLEVIKAVLEKTNRPLAPNGISKLQDIGFEPKSPKASIHFIHQLTESQVGAAFHALPIITFDEILAAPHTPEGAKESIPVQFTFKEKDYDYDLTPDGEPFAIQRTDSASSRRTAPPNP